MRLNIGMIVPHLCYTAIMRHDSHQIPTRGTTMGFGKLFAKLNLTISLYLSHFYHTGDVSHIRLYSDGCLKPIFIIVAPTPPCFFLTSLEVVLLLKSELMQQPSLTDRVHHNTIGSPLKALFNTRKRKQDTRWVVCRWIGVLSRVQRMQRGRGRIRGSCWGSTICGGGQILTCLTNLTLDTHQLSVVNFTASACIGQSWAHCDYRSS